MLPGISKRHNWTARLFFLCTLICVIFAYHLIFSQFFPNKHNNLGVDYTYFLPILLNGYYWFQSNGLFEVPWFTPAFCGGVPYLPNPQTMYYSFPQLLTFFTDPASSVYITFIVFALLGKNWLNIKW